MTDGFVACKDCKVWSDIPKGFKETIHFAKCPKCNHSMYLIRAIKPESAGLKENTKVVAGLIKHGEKI